ncbi:uncharacterized protein IL334_005737 [Kwoniella shivajii]|uniref:Histone acetyltransferase n=1 Tax=Kwoniella shivajii TaxID=564305 RepID=A0ABZ1D7Y4_9TREE|nr:hypothetical protein IL334_005737 [Kwoniella shivajii]
MRTPTRSSSRQLSVLSGVSKTPSKLAASPTPLHPKRQQQQYDIPIDPELLQEENDLDDMEDAEGELVDDELDLIAYGRDEQYIQPNPVASTSVIPTKQPRIGIFSSLHDVNPRSKADTNPKKRSRIARSSTSTPQPNGTPTGPSKPRQSALEKGKGKGKGINHVNLSAVYTPNQPRPVNASIVAREELCSFCAGSDEKNKSGERERMVSCAKCGRSGHPTCLNMFTSRLRARVMTYEWHCIECKTCEQCDVKGDDSRLMFCDTCDRGWHSYCLNPPLAKPPKGSWHCPICLGVPLNKTSLPSTSRSVPTITTSASRKGKGRATTSLTDGLFTPTGRPRKGGGPSRADAFVDDNDMYEDQSASRIKVKIPKRVKTKLVGNPRSRLKDTEDEGTPMIVRLRIPSGSGGGGNKGTIIEKDELSSEEEKIPYGGIIQGEEADTSKTKITERDKEEFEKSKKSAETKLGVPPISTDLPGLANSVSNSPMHSPGIFSNTPNNKDTQTPGRGTPLNGSRSLRDKLLQQSLESPSTGFPFPHTPTSNPHHHHHSNEAAIGMGGKLEKINKIRFGQFDIDTWYSAPYPEEYVHVPDGRLWLCEFCLKYMKSGFVAGRHRLKCKVRHPPGDEIYRDGAVSVFEVDGRKNKIYCQNLCLLAKMFLDHKTLYYDVEPFLFYVMTEVDDLGARFVGYFSKEKRSMDNNVSCIMTLPVRQRKGWGQLLIDFSYLLSKKEGRVGSPEKPLSGLGAVTYKGYWRLSVFRYLLAAPSNVTMDDISLATSITLEDIYSVLLAEDMIKMLDLPLVDIRTPYSRTPKSRNGRGRGGRSSGANGRSSVNRRKPVINDNNDDESREEEEIKIPKRYKIIMDREYLSAVVKKNDDKGYLTLRAERLKYHPFLVTRNPTLPFNDRINATLTVIGEGEEAQTPSSLNGDDDEAEVNAVEATEEEIIKGKDQATLNLVAELSASPVRSLRRKREQGIMNDGDDDDEREDSEFSLPEKSRNVKSRFNGRNSTRLSSTMSKSISPLNPSRGLRGDSTLPNLINGNHTLTLKKEIRKSTSFDSRRKRIMSSETEEEVEQIEDRSINKSAMNGNGNGNGNEHGNENGDGNRNGNGKDHENVVQQDGVGHSRLAVEDEIGPAPSVTESKEVIMQDEHVKEQHGAELGHEMDAEGEDIDAEGEDEDAEGEDDDEYIG